MDTNLDDNANPSVEPEIIDANDGSGTLVAVDDQQIINKEIVNTKPTTQSTGILSFVWSPVASLFGFNSKTKQQPEPIIEEIQPEEEKKEKKTYTQWLGKLVQKFGADAGKTMSDTLKDPLTQLAKSPVLRTGEVLVVHSVDFESLQLKRILYQLSIFIVFGRLSRHLLNVIFMGRRRSSQQTLALTDKQNKNS
ncbi:developmentally-regulated external PM-anchored protein [Acrasis kona]|uniref:Developmentally-regulated external PM-anchored protein n=1 Tax=Acrasis kona TaxID=1008807 RepID=A0AAW2ZFI1_9EUKA